MATRQPKPPSLAHRLLTSFLRSDLVEEVEGDLEEKFFATLKTQSLQRAKLNYWYQVIHYVRPFAIRKSTANTLNTYDMFENYFKIAWRNLTKQKMYSAIKIGGFSVGITACILITLFIRNELSYDKNYANGDAIFRLYNVVEGPDPGKWSSFPASIAQIMKSDFPEVEKAGRIIPYQGWYNAGNNLVRREDKVDNTFEEGFVYMDQELLDMLELPMVYGRRSDALAKPKSIVLSRAKAEKLFPGEDPTGKIIYLNDDLNQPYTVGGVIENMPSTTHLNYNYFITLTGVEFWPGEQTSWCCWNYNAYVQLRPGTDVEAFQKKLSSVRDTYYIGYLKETENASIEDVKKYYSIHLQPIGDVYLKSADIGDAIDHGDYRYVKLFGGVAAFILLLACINFINLSTAKSANRAKEVGLRKVVGSVRGHLVRQFLTESLLFCLIAFLIALLLVMLALPFFNQLSDRSLTIPWTSWWFVPSLVGSLIIVGILAGLYPSFYLSAFKPIDVLKGRISRGFRNSRLRSGMVIFQFTTSIVLIIGTFVIYRQMNFILNSKLGYDKEQVILLQGTNTMNGETQKTLKNELLRLSGVESATISSYVPVDGSARDQNQFWLDGRSKIDKGIGAQRWYVDEDYIQTMGMKLIEGRDFNPQIASDSQVLIINQAMARELGLKQPVGERVMNWETYEIIGVVEDFHFENMREKIRPLCLTLGNWGTMMSIKANTSDMRGTIDGITKVWKTIVPHQPIRYTFLDDSYARMYGDIERTANIFATFALLAIIVACLGLFALSAFMVEQRNKEISIRIVLGAPLKTIFRLLTQNFVIMVAISFVIAIPLGWYFMTLWLEDFAYSIPITADIFIAAGVMALLIAMLTVSYQSWRATQVNPVENLKAD